MRGHSMWLSVATIAVGSACIQVEQQQLGDVVTGSGPCGESPDCSHLDDVCVIGTCSNDTCVATPIEGSCKVDEICGGEGGYCHDGACVTQAGLCDDDTATGCERTVCGDRGACRTIPIGDSFCVNDLEKPSGACSGLAMDPLDLCDATGACSRTEPATTGPAALADRLDSGDWFMVLSSRLSGVSATRAGRVAFDDDGSVDVSDLQSQRLAAFSTLDGTWCGTTDGAVSLTLSAVGITTPIKLLGQVAPTNDALVAASATGLGESIMVALRAGGSTVDLDGLYRVLSVATDADGETTISVGMAEIERGMLGGAMTLNAPDGTSIAWTAGAQGAFTPGSNNLVLADFAVTAGNASEVKGFKGVVTLEGTLAMFVPTEDEDTIEDGFLLLVRAATQAPSGMTTPTTLAWTSVQLYRTESGGDTWFSAPTVLATRRGAINGGLFGTNVAEGDVTDKKGYIRGGGITFGTDQRFAVSFTADGSQRRLLGYLNEKNDFGFFVGTDPEEPIPLEDQPVVATRTGFGFVVVHPFPSATR
jgi:hypothetical protein